MKDSIEKCLPVVAALILERPEECHLQVVYHLKHENKNPSLWSPFSRESCPAVTIFGPVNIS